ncbi:hypothetical protein BKA83DRAFT_4192223 [Pisolithus microcarpus]|nr:hypothetical protein BKA83DRAFT_4192223 [Pisolithus microcarpus]
MLLQWCNLTPYGTSKLAAIRFASPCRVRSVRIFPTGARPFAAAPDIIARTEPEAFFMDVYFNAHPLQPSSQVDGKSKLKVPNALIPTVIPYAGGQAEFAVNMGADFATRLMIVRGDFEVVSMAIYGEPVSEVIPVITAYEALQLPVTEPTPVSPALDIARSPDPTLLARQLLSLIPDAPPLNLVIRLMFCLKPPNDDWDLPEFPHLYSDLHEEDMDIDLDSAYRCLSRPVADDVSPEALLRFAEKVAEAISPTDNTRSYFIAGILSRSASQHRQLVRMLVQTVDLERVFDTSSLDEDTVFALLDASTNPDIARLLDNDWFRCASDSVHSLPATEPEVKRGIRRLTSRLRDWQLFEDTLSNPSGDFVAAARFLRDIGSEEKSFGIWLSCMTTYEDLVASLQDGPTLDRSVPGALWDSESTDASHGDYIGFVKAFVGIACVLAVYAWSDSLPSVNCRERTLGVLRLWQDVPGYREIVNHLLLLRQMTFRLECMTMDNDPPAMPGIHAENIILNLVNEPGCYLSPHFVKCIRSWQPFSLTYISEEERISLDHAAAVAEDGLSSAIEEFAKSNSSPLNMDRVRALRVAIVIIQHHVDEESGDLQVLQTGWKENVYGLFFRAVDLAFEVAQGLKTQFALSVPPPIEKGLLEQYLLLSDQLLRLIAYLGPFAVTTTRTIRRLVDAVYLIFTSTDMVLCNLSYSPSVYAAARRAKQACSHVLRILSASSTTDSSKTRSTVVLRTLLQKSQVFHDDPHQQVRQIYELLTCLLPTPSDSSESVSKWVSSTLPVILGDLERLLCALDVDRKCELLSLLITLDDGVLDLGQWFISQELKHMSDLSRFVMEGQTEHLRRMSQQAVDRHIQTIVRLMSPSPEHATLCVSTLSAIPGAGLVIAETMTALLSAHVYSESLLRLARLLSTDSVFTDASVQTAVALTFIRSVSVPQIHSDVVEAFERARAALSAVDDAELTLDQLLWEFGHCLSAIAERMDDLQPSDLRLVLSTLFWLCEKLPSPSDLPGLSRDGWDKLCNAFGDKTTPETDGFLKVVKGKLTPIPDSFAPTRVIPQTACITIRDLETLLESSAPVPSTPKRKSPAQDVLGLVALSPPTALLRSPAISGLTKMYMKNDFRELRQTPSARQNTSRLPSMHVDEFEFSTLSPIVEPSIINHPVETFPLGPPFNLAQQTGM